MSVNQMDTLSQVIEPTLKMSTEDPLLTEEQCFINELQMEKKTEGSVLSL